VMTVSAPEFIRLFLQHVVPPGFQRIRYYGFLALTPHRQAHALPSVVGHRLFPTAAPTCRLPRVPLGTHPQPLPALSAVRQRHPHPPAILAALSGLPSAAPCGHLMRPPAPHPLSLSTHLRGRAYSPCARIASHASGLSADPAHRPSNSLPCRLPNSLRLPSVLLRSAPPLSYPLPESPITTLATEQNPFKVDFPVKV
jgi:hypothetical protein